jgi:hypothetical protein
VITVNGNADDDDVMIAITNVERAATDLKAVIELPREIGARIRWTSNGLAWTRMAPNGWWPDHYPHTPEKVAELRYWPSGHFTGGGWVIEDSPMPTADEVIAEQKRRREADELASRLGR